MHDDNLRMKNFYPLPPRGRGRLLVLTNGLSNCNGLNGLQPQQSKHKTATKVPIGILYGYPPSANPQIFRETAKDINILKHNT